jgi:hypothetical protein
MIVPPKARSRPTRRYPTTRVLSRRPWGGPGKKRIETWPISRLTEHPWQDDLFHELEGPEFDGLVDAMARGCVPEIQVTVDGTIVDGHQRIRAAKRLGWTAIPVWVQEDLGDDEDAIALAHMEANRARRQLDPLDRARLVRRDLDLPGDLLLPADPEARDPHGHLQLELTVGMCPLNRHRSVEQAHVAQCIACGEPEPLCDPLLELALLLLRKGIATGCARYYTAHPGAVELIVQERALFREGITPTHLLRRAEGHHGVEAELRRGIDRGELRPVDVRATYEAFGDLLFGSVVNGVLAGEAKSLVGRVERAVDLFLVGVVSDVSKAREELREQAPQAGDRPEVRGRAEEPRVTRRRR